MECDNCRKKFDGYPNYLLEDTQLKEMDYIFCSLECIDEFIKKEKVNVYEFIPKEVSYCPAVKVCDQLGNKRILCGRRETLEKYNRPDHMNLVRDRSWCESGIAGIILSNEKLDQSITKLDSSIEVFNESSSKLTEIGIVLAILMLIVAIITLRYSFFI